MPSVMLRRNAADELIFYVHKKDLEEAVVSVEYQGPEKWGGELCLADGSRFYLEPLAAPPKFPITVRVRRL